MKRAAALILLMGTAACGSGSGASTGPVTTAASGAVALTPGALGTSPASSSAGVPTTATRASAPSTSVTTPGRPSTSVAATSATLALPPSEPAPTTTLTVPRVLAPVVTAGVGTDPTAHTSCTTVLHIGDSTSYGMISPDILPVASTRLDAQYARVGVFDIHIDAVEARAIVEYQTGVTSGLQAATAFRDAGLHGCWVIALGTNDAANLARGNEPDARERIARLMQIIGDEPVLWVNARTMETDGFWAESNMLAWNAALDAARLDYPNLRVFDWASAAHDDWFRPHDGIHYTDDGYAARARLVADALASAFPA